MSEHPAFATVFHRTAVPMFLFDDDAVYVDANDAGCRTGGVAREELLGRRLGFLATPDRAREYALMWEALRRDGRLVMPYEYDFDDDHVTTPLNVVWIANTPATGLHLITYWKQPSPKPLRLSPREREITQLLARGLTGAQIAAELGLSPETVRTHIRNAMTRLGADTRAHLVAKALDGGLVSLGAVT
jgi:PAS domain S-box-containing protein